VDVIVYETIWQSFQKHWLPNVGREVCAKLSVRFDVLISGTLMHKSSVRCSCKIIRETSMR